MPSLRGPSALLRLQSDERLIAFTRRGHHAAFEVLCARYQTRLLAFCRHMLGSKEDAEDVLQEVFAAAFNAVLADDRPINVRPWLYRIARNRSLNHLRRATATGVDSMDVHFAEQGLSTGDKVLRRESFRELVSDVHQLPETQRTALLLREIDALSYEQIAQAMETTVPSVKSLLVRARISLAEAAEARKLSCDEVRLELGEVAEGLTKMSAAARRHVRGCDRCAKFRKQLRENNHALAMIMPVAPLLLVKKVLLTKVGSTASAGGAHVAGGAGVGASAGVGAGAAATGAAATGGGGFAGGVLTAGAGALATKAAAGLAAAAIVTAGAVAADHAVAGHHHATPAGEASVHASSHAVAPVIVAEEAQPVTAGALVARRAIAAIRHAAKPPAKPPAGPATPPPAVSAAGTGSTTTAAATPTATPVAPSPQPPASSPPSTTQVTEVTSQTTQLPPEATATTPTTTTTTTTPATTPPPVTTTTETPPPAPPSGGPSAEPVPVPEPPSTGGTPAP
jgi:RNA polymerase sigma factor (sigma-70 family)